MVCILQAQVLCTVETTGVQAGRLFKQMFFWELANFREEVYLLSGDCFHMWVNLGHREIPTFTGLNVDLELQLEVSGG